MLGGGPERSTNRPPTSVETVSRFPDGELAAAWEQLMAEDPAATLFHSARFLRVWCCHLQGRCDLRLRFVRRQGTVIGVVPEVREPGPDDRPIARFAGGQIVTDYRGPVARPADRQPVVDAWLGALAEEHDWSVVVAGGLAEDAGWHDLLAGRAARHGFSVDGPHPDGVCPRIDLTGGWDAYLRRISSKQRHEIRRKARKLSREAGMAKVVDVDKADLPVALEAFIALHRTAPGDKGTFFDDPATVGFFEGLADEFGADGTLRLHRLDVNDSPAALTVSLVQAPAGDRGTQGAREWGLYNSAYARELGSLAPGMVLTGELLRLAAGEGCQTMDLLRGDEPYKYRFGAVDRRLARVVLTRSRR